ncbi:hypothetical protein VZ95_13775 [Elstera litoralis]|uniref:Uncharacterized protein n=1 Tax=Elstera litoralis TaxID=552518 RepID=A0A0F3IQU1_9PROT|nr:hypothetical protein [Elstera litoralis]KJV09071.1 hypothetical protein VZ95_13775 [Elstera litoralis]
MSADSVELETRIDDRAPPFTPAGCPLKQVADAVAYLRDWHRFKPAHDGRNWRLGRQIVTGRVLVDTARRLSTRLTGRQYS